MMSEKFFKVRERGSTVSREIAGGVTTFLAMSYILAVNPQVISDSGIPWGAAFTATALSAAIATLAMAFLANLPVALASGMGLNAFFTYTVVQGMGCSPNTALTAVLLEGLLFLALSLFGVREAIVNSIPETLRKAIAVALGLFIAFVGFENTGIITNDAGTPVAFVPFNMTHAPALVAVLGLVITVVLSVRKVPGAILLGLIATTIIGIPFGVTTIPKDFTPFSTPSMPYFFKFEWTNVISLKFFIIFFTFLFTDMFDTVGTFVGIAEQANLKDENGAILSVRGGMLADATGTVVGACLGTSTVTSFIESASGVAAGARTGLSSLVTALLCLSAIFLSPLFSLVPPSATAPALVFVGFMMMKSVIGIDFTDLTEGIPAFITIIVMPFSYSISKGIIFGMISYILCKVASNKIKEIPFVTWIIALVFLVDLVFEAIK